jgi:ribosomal protein S18 acetylase RimI-like enzyme
VDTSRRSDAAVELPTGYVLRHPTPRDAPAVAEVVTACDVADFGEPDFTLDDLLDDWQRPRFEPACDAWCVTGPTGRVVGYAFCWEAEPARALEADAFVLPEYAGRGLGSTLCDLVERRAGGVATAAGAAVTLTLPCPAPNASKRVLLERRGFEHRSSTLRLRIDLRGSRPRRPEPPEEVTIRAFRPADDAEALRGILAEAFATHHRFSPRRLDEWLHLRLLHPAFDPALWRVAEHRGEVVGAVLVYDVGRTGYLSSVAVQEAWRRRGVGQALLGEAFAALEGRGQMRVVVTVEAAGAPETVRLYEAAGMHVHERHDWYSKRIRPAPALP